MATVTSTWSRSPWSTVVPTSTGSSLASVVWLEQMERGRFVRHTLEMGFPVHAALAAADYDLDGDIDIVVGNFSNQGRELPGWVEKSGEVLFSGIFDPAWPLPPLVREVADDDVDVAVEVVVGGSKRRVYGNPISSVWRTNLPRSTCSSQTTDASEEPVGTTVDHGNGRTTWTMRGIPRRLSAAHRAASRVCVP